MAPLRIEVSGSATIYRPAERAVVSIGVRSEGNTQEEVSRNVAVTSSRIRDLLTGLAGKDDKGQALSTAAITHWSNSSLSTGSYFNYSGSKKKSRVYSASTSFEAKFQDFAKLGSVATSLSTMEHVSVHNIEWRLTDKTKASIMTQCRYDAMGDAMAKAKDFAAALDRTVPPVVEVKDSSSGGAPVYAMTASRKFKRYSAREDDQPELNFEPEDVSLECSVFIVLEEKA